MNLKRFPWKEAAFVGRRGQGRKKLEGPAGTLGPRRLPRASQHPESRSRIQHIKNRETELGLGINAQSMNMNVS